VLNYNDSSFLSQYSSSKLPFFVISFFLNDDKTFTNERTSPKVVETIFWCTSAILRIEKRGICLMKKKRNFFDFFVIFVTAFSK
jgi:hypothetical protein